MADLKKPTDEARREFIRKGLVSLYWAMPCLSACPKAIAATYNLGGFWKSSSGVVNTTRLRATSFTAVTLCSGGNGFLRATNFNAMALVSGGPSFLRVTNFTAQTIVSGGLGFVRATSFTTQVLITP